MNNTLILLKTLHLSTDQWNIYRHTGDSKKRRKIVWNFIGSLCIYAMIIGYSIAMCLGYGHMGMIREVPVMCALLISSLAFILTLFKTNGYLFNFKEYDMLMSLPFETRTVAMSKFLYMYVQSLPWYLSISMAMMIGYGIFAHPSIVVYPLWLLLSLFLPIIPMLAAAFLGFLIAKISSGHKSVNIVQTVLTLVIVIFSFSLRFIIEDLVRNDKVQATLESTSELTNNIAKIYMPAGWFADAVTRQSITSILLLIGLSALLIWGVFTLVSRSYRQINSALKSHAASKDYKMSSLKQHSVVNAIAYKEYRKLIGSTPYLVNAGMGMILASLVGLITMVLGPEKIIQVVLEGAPIDVAMLRPAIPFIVYFFIGMVSTTACSPSLEGKNYWILQSLPIEKKTVYQGKMLFNLYLTVPFMAFSTLCLCISGKVPFLNTVLYLLLGLALCAFSTAWGCVCGVRHMNLNWVNEIEVIKRGTAVAVYMLPNMFVVMGLTVGVVFLGTRVDHNRLTLGLILIAAILALLSYKRVMRLAAEEN